MNAQGVIRNLFAWKRSEILSITDPPLTKTLAEGDRVGSLREHSKAEPRADLYGTNSSEPG